MSHWRPRNSKSGRTCMSAAVAVSGQSQAGRQYCSRHEVMLADRQAVSLARL